MEFLYRRAPRPLETLSAPTAHKRRPNAASTPAGRTIGPMLRRRSAAAIPGSSAMLEFLLLALGLALFALSVGYVYACDRL